MLEFVDEIVALDPLDGVDVEAQQHFHALEFPAKHGSSVMAHLTTHFQPLSAIGYAHLKRMKKHPEERSKLIALIAPFTDAAESSEDSKLFVTQLLELEKRFHARTSSVYVLKHAPRTRELFDKHTLAWPLIFHASVAPDAQVEPISERDAQAMATYLRSAVSLAAQFTAARAADIANADPALQPLPFCCAHGVVVVDPNDATQPHVADSFTHRLRPEYAFAPLCHPVMIAIDGVAERDRQRNAAASLPVTATHKRLRQDDATESYLCTGYDVYLDREPCVMCAMALVHSRARRVVFAALNPTDGALASAHRLHTIASLNHHYRVFHMRLDDALSSASASAVAQ